MKATEETKAKAKELGIERYWLKSEETLIAEMGGIEETETTTVEVEENTPDPEPVIETVAESLPDDIDPKIALFSIKVLHTKSPYWKYKDLL